MSSLNFNVRGVSPEIMTMKKKKAQVNHDLDYLANTWSEKDAQEFEKNTSFFEKIDNELWL